MPVQNFQRDLGAIGPCEFQGQFVWTNGPLALNLHGPMALNAHQKFPPRLVLVHGCLFILVPSLTGQRNGIAEDSLGARDTLPSVLPRWGRAHMGSDGFNQGFNRIDSRF